MGTADDRAGGGMPFYARPVVRLRAALYDYALLWAAFIATLVLAKAADSASNAVFATGTLLIALYDPVLVSWRGRTLGHQLCNLRVIDDRSQTNPGFLKSFLRFLVKTVLGWLSFVTTLTSKRMKAIHDIATGTSLILNDADRMRTGEFSELRVVPAGLVMPSALRRGVGILLYAILTYIVLTLFVLALAMANLIAMGCLDGDQCRPRDTLVLGVAGLGWIAGLFAIVGLGWWGRLPGFRAKRMSVPET